MPQLLIRPLAQDDLSHWRRLWSAYLAFYDARVSDQVFRSTWSRLFSGEPFDPQCLLAILAGRPVGLVHFIFHRSCWTIGNVCYLQDLYVDPEARGKGAGRTLIEAVYDQADRAGAASVYWLTQDSNETARKLYDRVARQTSFIKYQR